MYYRRIRDLREDSDLTQMQIAQAINVTQRSYSYYETGTHMIPPWGAERPRGLSPYQRGLSPRPHQRARPVSPAASLNGRGLFSPAASFLKLRVL